MKSFASQLSIAILLFVSGSIGYNIRPGLLMTMIMIMMSLRRRVVSQMHKRDMGTRYIECFYDEDD